MNVEDFLENSEAYPGETEESVEAVPEELDIQKAVVEELAADKAKLDEKVSSLQERVNGLQNENGELKSSMEALGKRNSELEKLLEEANSTVSRLQGEIAALQEREFDAQERNPNALALLDRDVDLPDRFPGETRDQVIEVVREARDKAEAEGRVRRAQILEGVLVANEPSGNLAKKRAALEKFFKDNGNILSGPVIEELQRCGIPYKNGQEYLLPSEILVRTY